MDNESTVTTECPDGPGCYLPLPKLKCCQPIDELDLDEATPKAKTVRKSTRSKRVIKKAKRATGAGDKRKYTKKASRFNVKSDDVVKITLQTPQDTTIRNCDTQMRFTPNKTDGLAPPFSTAIPMHTYLPPFPSSDPLFCTEAMNPRRFKLLRYFKKKYAVKKARHVYKAR